jgi:hypothetical protein
MSTPDRILIDAARHYARRVAGQAIQRITLILADGSKRRIDMLQSSLDDWPPDEGWSVRGCEGSCDGVNFPLSGKCLAVFTELVGAGKEGVELGILKTRVWDFRTDDRTVQNTVSRLRKELRDALGLGEEVETVEVLGDKYRLGLRV